MEARFQIQSLVISRTNVASAPEDLAVLWQLAVLKRSSQQPGSTARHCQDSN